MKKIGIGNNIRAIRMKHGISQYELAQKLHVKQTAVSYWETGKREPDIDTINRLREIFSVTYNDLLANTQEEIREMQEQEKRERVKTLVELSSKVSEYLQENFHPLTTVVIGIDNIRVEETLATKTTVVKELN